MPFFAQRCTKMTTFDSLDGVMYLENLSDLKELQSSVIAVRRGADTINVGVSVRFFFIGDILAQHSIGGFSECFSSGASCRFCLSSTFKQPSKFTEAEQSLRDSDSFKAQLLELENCEFPKALARKYGITATSPLCDIKESFPVQNLPPDVCPKRGCLVYMACCFVVACQAKVYLPALAKFII